VGRGRRRSKLESVVRKRERRRGTRGRGGEWDTDEKGDRQWKRGGMGGGIRGASLNRSSKTSREGLN